MPTPFRDIADYTPGELLADLKIATFIKEMALGIAEAQKALDENSVQQALELATTPIPGLNKTLIELGLSPPFYHFQYADLEVNLSMSFRVQKEFGLDVEASASSNSSSSAESSSTSVGTTDLTITQDEASPATATLEFSANEEGQVKVAGQTVKLVDPPGGSDIELDDTLSKSAKLLADALEALEDDGEPILKSPVKIEMVSDGDVSASSSSRGFEISRTNITVLDEDATNAIALVGMNLESDAKFAYTLTRGTPLGSESVGFDSGADIHVTLTSGDVETSANDLADAITTTSTISDAEVIAIGNELLDKVYFDFDSYQIHGNANAAAIERVVKLMKRWPSLKITLEGHADPSGDDGYNINLGKARANAVKTLLVDAGVSSTRLDTDSKGEEQPVDATGHDIQTPANSSTNTNTNPANHTMCRRVEFHLDDFEYDFLLQLESVDAGSGADEIEYSEDSATESDLLASEEGEGERRLADGDILTITAGTTNVDFTARTTPSAANEFEITSGDPEATAEALAEAIEGSTSLTDVNAVASDATVAISGSGATVYLTLTTTKKGDAANNTSLSASGSLRVSKPFSKGKDAKAPEPGDTVSIGKAVFAVSDPDDPDSVPDGADYTFAMGDDADATARNLASRINDALDGEVSAAVAANVVTIAGTPGTALAVDSENDAFKLGSKKIGGTKELKSSSSNQAKAFALSVDVHYAKKYDLSISGNSSIKARLVAIPAPADFLDEIKAYLAG